MKTLIYYILGFIPFILYSYYPIYLRTNVFVTNDSHWNPYIFGGMPAQMVGTKGYPYYNLIYVFFDVTEQMIFHAPLLTIIFIVSMLWFYRAFHPGTPVSLPKEMKTKHLIRNWFLLLTAIIFFYVVILTPPPIISLLNSRKYTVLGEYGMPRYIIVVLKAIFSIYLLGCFFNLIANTIIKVRRVKTIKTGIKRIGNTKPAIRYAVMLLAEMTMLYVGYYNFAVHKGWLEPVSPQRADVDGKIELTYESGDIIVIKVLNRYEQIHFGEDVLWNPYPTKVIKDKCNCYMHKNNLYRKQ